ncbi:MAG: RNA-directed DNA polymerase, partial [Saprospiraceae bacterium]|nr:RNA-directed DNA polymerase [Saprospiraceae bacterium]
MTQSYFRAPISKSLSSQDLHAKGQLLVKAGSLKDLAMVLGFEEKWIREQAASPSYYSFKAPKANGSTRQIDNPNPKLKDFLRVLADLLQGLYYGVRPRAAYAFIPATSDQTSPFNIYTNALQHCKSKWVLQLDLKNFFHSITIHRIRELFLQLPFKFPEDTAQVLAKVCTFQNRLPIGAPTSPVISNFVCFELDHRLDKMARDYDWTYTRYADDITFSGPRKFTNDSVEMIRKEIEDQEFILNTEKTSHHRIQDEPEVCG